MRAQGGWLRVLSVLGLAFLYLPIAVLMVFSMNASRLSATWQGFSWQWYEILWRDDALRAATGNSLLVAAISTVIVMLLGMPAAMGLERVRPRWRGLLDPIVLLPLVIPEVMMGVALLLLFVLLRMPLSMTTVIVGHAAFNLPVAILVIRARLQKLDPRLLEAAYDLGATPWQGFWRVTLPLLFPAILGAALLAFTISLDDFIVTFFVAGPGATTLPLKVYSMIKSGVSPEINALSAVLVMVSMGLVGLSLLFQRR
ncbi:MAG: ABC transporter permease [Nitrospira sp.]|jgi:spermidine/putrescine transport system permease protein|nr:ABC transporter permease [Nitrospira sp.]